MINFIDDKRIEKLSKTENDYVALYQRVIKMGEESGELSKAFLAYQDAENKSNSESNDETRVIEEACDCINVAMDIINAMVEERPDLELEARRISNSKLDKWEAKQANYGEGLSICLE